MMLESTSHLNIARMNCACLAPREHPAPDTLSWRVGRVARGPLAAAIGQAVERVLDPDDPAVWLIRRLDVDLALDTGRVSEDHLAQALSSSVAVTLARIMARGEDGDAVLRFPDRAAYLAQFVIDLARDCAWDRWYYALFDGLRPLPAGAAIVAALTREPEQIQGVLDALAWRGELERVLAALTESGAMQLYDHLAGTATLPAGAEARQLASALLLLWPRATLRPPLTSPRNALRLLAQFRAQFTSHAANSELRALIDALLCAAEALRVSSTPEVLASALAHGHVDAAVWLAQAGPDDQIIAATWAQLGAGDAAWLQQAIHTLRPDSATLNPSRHAGAGRAFFSAFPGLFLLLPAMLQLALDELVEVAIQPLQRLDAQTAVCASNLCKGPPDPSPDERAGLAAALRVLVALKCLGRPRAGEAVWDEAIPLAAGASAAAVSRVRTLDQPLGEDAASRFMVRLAEHGLIDGQAVLVDLVAADPPAACPVLVFRDAATGTWLRASPADDVPATLADGLAIIRQSLQPLQSLPLERLFVAPSLAAALEGTSQLEIGATHFTRRDDVETWQTWVAVGGVDTCDVIGDAPGRPVLEVLRRARSPEADLAYLLLGGLPLADGLSSATDVSWSAVAQAVLSLFMRQRLGFERSSAEYTYRNFLAGHGAIQVTAGEVNVPLPPCPLQMILRMSGMDGRSFDVPWMELAHVRLVTD